MLSVEEGSKAERKFVLACLDYAELFATVNDQFLLANW